MVPAATPRRRRKTYPEAHAARSPASSVLAKRQTRITEGWNGDSAIATGTVRHGSGPRPH